MKKLFLVLLVLPLFFSFRTDIFDLCDDEGSRNKATLLLNDYAYSAAKTSKFYFINNEQIREIEVNLFEGEDYRIVFNNESLPQNIEVRVYVKPKDNKFRKMLFSSKSTPSEKIFLYEPSWKNRILYITYVVPPSTSDKITKGCAVFVMGYKLNFM